MSQPKVFELQPHQLYLKEHIGTKFENENRMLLFHGLGSGKTCSAITAGLEFYKTHGDGCKIVTITPASLKKNFEKELIGQCGQIQMTNGEGMTKTSLKKHLISIFNIMSYQRFVKHVIPTSTFNRKTLLIVDEVQNIISKDGKMYEEFAKITKNTDVSVLFLSATPIFNDSIEVALLANLLQVKDGKQIDVNKFQQNYGVQLEDDDSIDDVIDGKESVEIKNKIKLKGFFKNKISFFRGHDLAMYPRKSEYNVYCPMFKFQYDGYKESLGTKTFDFDYLEMSNVFLSGPRITSNVVYPDGGINKISARKFRKFPSKKYAIKFHICIRNIAKSAGPVFVYSNFVESGGTKTFAKILLTEFGYEEYGESESSSKSPRFAVYKSGQNEQNCKILNIFNSYENKDGDLIKIIIGSPTMKEGCTLLRTREVHILEPYWNESRTRQIIGRAVRFCSHSDLPEECRRVKVFHYIAIAPDEIAKPTVVRVDKEQPTFKETTADIYIKKTSMFKEMVISHYVNLMKEVAIDCKKFKKYNQPPKYKCHTDPHTDTGNVDIDEQNTKKRKKTVKSSTTENQYFKTNIDFNERMNRTSCPKSRTPNDENECPETHPYLKTNKYKDKCCYKTSSKAVKGCPKQRRPVSGECSDMFPHARKNKHNVDCCYKKKKSVVPT